MIRATLTRLSSESFPWRYAMQIKSADPPEFEYLIADLKNCVPSRQRKWDGDRRRWLFKEDVGEAVIALLKGHSALIDYEDEAPAHRQVMSASEAAATLYLLPSAPPWIVDCVYRAMAKRLHPDAGGDTEQMQRINAAVEVLRSREMETA